jgi:WD40 repeat protein
MQILSGRRHRVEELAFSRDGRWLAAGWQGGLHVWDTADPTAPPQRPAVDNAGAWETHIAFRPDGKLLFQTNIDELYLHDPSRPKQTPAPVGECGEVVVLSPNGRHVVQVGVLRPLERWTFGPDDKLLQESTVRPDRMRTTFAAFSPDSATLATIGYTPGPREMPRLVLRDADTLKPIRNSPPLPLYWHTRQLLFSPDGAKVILLARASLVCWDVATLKEPQRVTNPSRKHFLSMDFHPDGQLLTVDNDRLVGVWDVETMSVVRSVEWNIGKLYAVAVSPDGSRAAVGSHTGKVLVWDWD